MRTFVGLLRPVTALLLASAIATLGHGLLSGLVPIRGQIEGFTSLAIGVLGSANYAGFLIGCVLTPALVARVGHIRSIAAITAMLAVFPLLFVLSDSLWAWLIARFGTGFGFSAFLVAIESWLAGASNVETRGRVMSVYLMLHQVMFVIGLQLMGFADPATFALFSVVAILFSVSAIPISLTGTVAPPLPRKPKIRLAWIIGVSPAAAIGCFLNGLTNAAVLSLAPIYAQSVGFDVAGVAALIAVAMLAGAAAQIPIGTASDRLGRRPMLVFSGLMSSAGGAALFLVSIMGLGQVAVFLAMALYGAMSFAIYGLAVAHANDLVAKKRAVEVSSALMLIYSFGAVAGPFIASIAMETISPAALFLYTAICHAMLASVVFIRRQMRPVLPRKRRRRFRAITRTTTPAVYGLDPRAEPPPEAAAPETVVEALEQADASAAEGEGGDARGDVMYSDLAAADRPAKV
ncbi:MAG: MFS transporter [Pseudomonadota bacterium]